MNQKTGPGASVLEKQPSFTSDALTHRTFQPKILISNNNQQVDKQTLFKQLSGSSILRPLQLKLDRSCTLPTQASMTANTDNNNGPLVSRKNSNVLGTMSNLDEPSVMLP